MESLIFYWLQILGNQKITKLLEKNPVMKLFQIIIIYTQNSRSECLFIMNSLTQALPLFYTVTPLFLRAIQNDACKL